MQDRRARTKDDSNLSPGKTGESILESPGDVVVTHREKPPKNRGDKQIHPRRPLPPVPTSPPSENENDGERD